MDRIEARRNSEQAGRNGTRAAALLCACAAIVATTACTPTVKVATDEPITINLNVNIRHEILVKVDQKLDTAIDANSEIF